MKALAKFRHLALALLFAALAGGCASSGTATPGDPFEGVNRAVFSFNEGFDKVLMKPVATAYKTVVPEPARACVGNVFANINDIFVSVNSLLQGKGKDAVTDICRVAINTTIGIGGCFDVASKMGLEKHNRDFGQTFGKWGVTPGPYLVIPILGPSNFRDGIGTAITSYLDPVWRISHVPTRNLVAGIRAVQIRSDLLTAGDVLEEAALDKYSFVRDAYLQRRQGMVEDDDNRADRRSGGGAAPTVSGAVPATLWFDEANQRGGERATAQQGGKADTTSRDGGARRASKSADAGPFLSVANR